jgi:hypothetical protein
MKFDRETDSPEKQPGISSLIIVGRPYAHLEKELRRIFKEQNDVEVVVDRRFGQRRKRRQPVALEKRKAERRLSKKELLEVVILT